MSVWTRLLDSIPLTDNMVGAQLWFFEPEPGSNVPASVFMDEALQIPHTHPVIADAMGKFPPIFMDMSKRIEGRLKNYRGVTILTDSDARSWCGPIPSLTRLRAIEAAARALADDFGDPCSYDCIGDGLIKKVEAVREALK